MTAATKTKQQTKLDRLLAQGEWIAVEIDGMKVPYLKMPSPELQSALNGELDKKIKKHLKADGFELLHATRREHPFHSDLLRERIDELAALLGGHYDPTLEDEAEREKYAQTLRDIEAKFGGRSCEEQIAAHVARALRENRSAWAKGFNKYRDALRDPLWWKGTYVDRAINPPDGAPLPDGPPPKPVYLNKERPGLVIQLQGSLVHLYTRVAA
jgi:hypothetical protein